MLLRRVRGFSRHLSHTCRFCVGTRQTVATTKPARWQHETIVRCRWILDKHALLVLRTADAHLVLHVVLFGDVVLVAALGDEYRQNVAVAEEAVPPELDRATKVRHNVRLERKHDDDQEHSVRSDDMM